MRLFPKVSNTIYESDLWMYFDGSPKIFGKPFGRGKTVDTEIMQEAPSPLGLTVHSLFLSVWETNHQTLVVLITNEGYES